MIVMPAFAEGDQSQKSIVSTGILGVESAGTVHMIKRIDRHRAVKQDDGGNKKSPDEQLRTAGGETGGVSLEKAPNNKKANCQ